ncbi:MAG: hypothetical protein PHV12_04630 [Bacteroidales bacterium]|jgi:hypothetical protein|nr:hypothetical protein [Bacteroidales bacterium]MDD3273581.1 hypothetical protein [Bacteroidales bacterium]MDD4058822.1 hypothetical protein [Bacteroidales bacterium]
MKKIILAAAVLIMSTSAFSQNYKTSIGLRTGTSLGASIKHFISQPGAIEGILDVDLVRHDEMKIKATGLYEYHFDVNVDGLYVYAGAGATAGVHVAGLYSKQFMMGIDLIGGVEYKFNNIPLALSADWNPRIQIISNPGFKVTNLGFTVRYIIK